MLNQQSLEFGTAIINGEVGVRSFLPGKLFGAFCVAKMLLSAFQLCRLLPCVRPFVRSAFKAGAMALYSSTTSGYRGKHSFLPLWNIDTVRDR